jgi:hypothetical protein
MSGVKHHVSEVARETVLVYWGLAKIIVPVMVIVEILLRMGAVGILADWMEPVMSIVGLPATLSIVLATNLFVGFYGAVAALVALLPGLDLTVADTSILAGIMLISHALPIEQSIVRKTRVGIILPSIYRFLAGFLYGFILHIIFDTFSLLTDPVSIIWSFDGPTDNSIKTWILQSAQMLFWLFVILFGLIFSLKIMEIIGITEKIVKTMAPMLKFLGIGPNAAPLVMVGTMLGLGFGGALIIREVEKDHLTPKSLFLSMYFMMLCHGLIEDSLLAITMGSHWVPAVLGRIGFSIVMALILRYIIFNISDEFFYKYLLKPQKKTTEEEA